MALIRPIPSKGKTLPSTPTASGECYINTSVLLQFDNTYSIIHGTHSIDGSCVISVVYIDENGYSVGSQDDILSLPNSATSSASLTVPSNTAFIQVNERGTGISSTSTQVWFS